MKYSWVKGRQTTQDSWSFYFMANKPRAQTDDESPRHLKQFGWGIYSALSQNSLQRRFKQKLFSIDFGNIVEIQI